MLIRTHHVKETMILWMCVRSDIRSVCLCVMLVPACVHEFFLDHYCTGS